MHQVQFDVVVAAFSLSELPSKADRTDVVQTLWRKTGRFLVSGSPFPLKFLSGFTGLFHAFPYPHWSLSSFLTIFLLHRSLCPSFQVSICIIYVIPISFKIPTLFGNALTELPTFMFSCNSRLLTFPFCNQVLVENGTKAGHSLLMDARDLVLNVRFFRLLSPYPPFPAYSHRFLALS